MKIPDSLEEEIEEVLESGKIEELTAPSNKIGVSEVREDLLDEYLYFFRWYADISRSRILYNSRWKRLF